MSCDQKEHGLEMVTDQRRPWRLRRPRCVRAQGEHLSDLLTGRRLSPPLLGRCALLSETEAAKEQPGKGSAGPYGRGSAVQRAPPGAGLLCRSFEGQSGPRDVDAILSLQVLSWPPQRLSPQGRGPAEVPATGPPPSSTSSSQPETLCLALGWGSPSGPCGVE